MYWQWLLCHVNSLLNKCVCFPPIEYATYQLISQAKWGPWEDGHRALLPSATRPHLACGPSWNALLHFAIYLLFVHCVSAPLRSPPLQCYALLFCVFPYSTKCTKCSQSTTYMQNTTVKCQTSWLTPSSGAVQSSWEEDFGHLEIIKEMIISVHNVLKEK